MTPALILTLPERLRQVAGTRRVHIIGVKNSGKTTLLVELVEHLTARGHRVGTIKHTHHGHELDTPGKDSHQHRRAGARTVAVLSPALTAVFWPNSSEPAQDPYRRLATAFVDCELVLVEGDVQAQAPRIEVWRAATGVPPYAATDDTILAVVTDDPLDVSVPTWPRSDVAAVAARVLEICADEQ